MNSVIIHISDLHVSLDKKLDGTDNKHDSHLTTVIDNEKSILFIDKFIESIKRNFDGNRKYLLITGDITNEGEKKEFDFALQYLERIVNRLSINKNDILLIPGDHDLNRRDIESLLSKAENSTNDEISEAKFQNFSEFYSNFLGKNFISNNIIVDKLIIENAFELIGLNSCTTINLLNKLGNVPILKFEEEFVKFEENKLKKVICCHHNFTSSFENKNDGQWNTENRQSFIQKLISKGIQFVFTGNEHTQGMKNIKLGQLITSDSGCISSLNYESSYKVYEIVLGDDMYLKNHLYSLQNINKNDLNYEWDVRTNKIFDHDDKFVIFNKYPPQLENEVVDIFDNSGEADIVDSSNETTIIENEERYINIETSEFLYEQVKQLNLFHSGHFHWSETSRAHNWIDTSKLIESKENLDFVKNVIIDVIEQKDIQYKAQIIIGLGYEGNIISTKAAIKFNLLYTFLPYSYREEEHNNFENELNFENLNGEIQNVLIITDVVNDGRTIRKLVKNHWSFFEKVINIYVISLFYTGHLDLNSNILNYDIVKNQKDFDPTNDEEINNLTFYSVKSLKVEKCPYGKDFRTSCLIVKDKLGCVNLFYDDTKFLMK